MDGCSKCGKNFIKKKGSFNRRTLSASFTPKTSRELFPDIGPTSFICYDCADSFNEKTKRLSGTRKRRLVYSPHGKSGVSPAAKRISRRTSLNPETKSRIAKAFAGSSYQTGLRQLVNASKPALEATLVVVGQLIKKEISAFVKQKRGSSIFSQELSHETLESFSWDELLEESEMKLPITTRLTQNLFPKENTFARQFTTGGKKSKRTMDVNAARSILNSRHGLILAIALYSGAPKKNKFIQSSIAAEMWRQQCSQKMFSTLNRFGISQQVGAARAHVDILGAQHASDILEWKSDVQSFVENGRQETGEAPPPNGYCLGWDNVQINPQSKHESKGQGPNFLLWGMCFGTQNRIPTVHFPSADKRRAADLQPFDYLPSPSDYENLRDRMTFIVSRILCKNLTMLSPSLTPQHLNHAHTKEMGEKSKIVNLGVVSANPSSTEGTITIMHHLQKFVPMNGDEFTPILTNGDNLSIERMRGSKRASINSVNATGRLDGLVESPQEFHKEALLLQDKMNLLFKSSHSRGTISQLKIFFDHRRLKHKVMDNFKLSFEMFEFCTEAYILLLALKLRGMKSLGDQATTYPNNGSDQKKKTWVRQLAMEIVEACWAPINMGDIRQAADAFRHGLDTDDEDTNSDNIFPFCHCETDKDDSMLLCCNANCIQQWYHHSCIKNEPVGDSDWYCSEECSISQSYVYCLCQRKQKNAGMIQCHKGEQCTRVEWYHLKCVGIKGKIPEIWHCSEECELGAEEDDAVLNYSKSLIWEGLNLLVRRDAVREGDGPEIVSHWKIDLLQFWMKGHCKYFVTACQFLAGVGGLYGQRIQQDLIWNRLANVNGRRAGNIGLDLLNEFLNNDFKGMLKHSRGRYTEKQVQRIAEMSGAHGRKLDDMFTAAGLGEMDGTHYNVRPAWSQRDLATFVEEFEPDALVDYCPVRAHKGFDGFSVTTNNRLPRKLGTKIAMYAKENDFWQELHDDLAASTT